MGHHFMDYFPSKHPLMGDFPLPCLISEGYELAMQCASSMPSSPSSPSTRHLFDHLTAVEDSHNLNVGTRRLKRSSSDWLDFEVPKMAKAVQTSSCYNQDWSCTMLYLSGGQFRKAFLICYSI